MTGKTLVVFDGDDTLWATEPLYDEARHRIRVILGCIGIDGARWEIVERKTDLERVATHGYAWHRFPRSCGYALAEVDAGLLRPVKWLLTIMIFAIALTVFLKRPKLVPGVKDVLREVGVDRDLVLITKGDPRVQRHRVRQSGLEAYFGRCLIVRDKTPQTFHRFAPRVGGTHVAISVGNSLASDIEPALRMGFAGIHLDGYMWEHERRDSPSGLTGVIWAPTLRDVPGAILQIEESCR